MPNWITLITVKARFSLALNDRLIIWSCVFFIFIARDAPYAKARTTFVRDVQLARTVLSDHFKPVYRDPASATPSQSSTLL